MSGKGQTGSGGPSPKNQGGREQQGGQGGQGGGDKKPPESRGNKPKATGRLKAPAYKPAKAPKHEIERKLYWVGLLDGSPLVHTSFHGVGFQIRKDGESNLGLEMKLSPKELQGVYDAIASTRIRIVAQGARRLDIRHSSYRFDASDVPMGRYAFVVEGRQQAGAPEPLERGPETPQALTADPLPDSADELDDLIDKATAKREAIGAE